MRHILAWITLAAFGLAFALAAPQPGHAQQTQEAPAEASAQREPGRLGVELRDLMPQSVKAIGLNQERAILVVFPASGGPAERAGLRPGDVIVELDGAAVGPLNVFIPALQRLGAGRMIALGLLRGGERQELQVTLARAADIPQEAPAEVAEKRIAAHEALVGTLSRASLPLDWATTQYNLGNAYHTRTRGDRADNLEKAIGAYQAALTVTAREALPRDWAATQDDLGVAYQDRILGNRTDNLEKAISAHQAALTVRTREALPREWALTQNNLGVAYWNRILGDRADNLEKAIGAFQAALTVRTREAFPHDWALTQNNLGVAYKSRILGDRADNQGKAIGAYQAALTVRTREALPREWADTQNNLGVAYQDRTQGDGADNLEKAIAAYHAALTVRTREALPRSWAETQTNLGNAYQVRSILRDRADNLEKAIAAYQAALTVTTREALPREWAATQNNLGNAYRTRILGDQADNLEKAIGAYQAALTVRTREALPRDHVRTGWLLGAALLQAREWGKAGTAYASAREAFLQLFGQGLNDAEARDLIAQAGPLFAGAAFAAVQRGDLRAALELANEGRARQLRVALRRQVLELPAEKRPRYDALTAELRGWERLAEAVKGPDAVAAVDRVAALRQQLSELIAPHLPREAGLTREAVPQGSAVVVPIVTSFGGKLLIVGQTPGLTPIVIDLPHLTSDRLDRLMRGQGKDGGWLGAYKAQDKKEGPWLAAIEGLGPELWALIGEALDKGLKARGLKPGARIAILPTGALGLLPLGLAQDPASKRRLAETWEIVHAPSFEALATARVQVAQAAAPSLVAAINPTGDLPFTEIEGALVAARFAGRPQLKLDTSVATANLVVAALEGRSYWHFASHGAFDWNDARQSGLVMREGERLTVGKLIEAQGGLGRPRLVVLSACETGLYDISRNPDEFIGLPAAFMQAGAAGVVGSLWLVDDLATALLMAKFYDLHLGSSKAGGPKVSLPPPAALRQAQAWLRDSTRAELMAYARAAGKQARIDGVKLAELTAVLTRGRRSASSRFAGLWEVLEKQETAAPQKKRKRAPAMKARPFEHPYFWAGFVYTGL